MTDRDELQEQVKIILDTATSGDRATISLNSLVQYPVNQVMQLIDKYAHSKADEARIDENKNWQALVLARQEIHSSNPYINVLEYEKRNEEIPTLKKGSKG